MRVAVFYCFHIMNVNEKDFLNSLIIKKKIKIKIIIIEEVTIFKYLKVIHFLVQKKIQIY